VQETFISAYLKLGQLKDPAALAGWLKTTLTRYCHKSKKQKSLYAGAYAHILPADEECNDEINRKLDLYAQHSQLYAAVACLSGTLQSVLLLRYFSNWQAYEQIAQVLCLPVGTVRSRLNQAKQKIIQYWQQCSDDNDTAYREAQQWNYLYNSYFSGLHSALSCREKLLQHLDKDLHLVFTSGKTAFGRQLIEKEIEGDLLHGNVFGDIQVISSGRLSIIELQNINSPEYPDRCPESSILLMFRDKNKVTRMNLHNSH
jgi:RNA polymerase sigma factor (sigma-70 family)